MELNIPPHPSRNHKVSPPHTSSSQFHHQNPITNQPHAQANRWDLSTAPQEPYPQSHPLNNYQHYVTQRPTPEAITPQDSHTSFFRSNESNKTAHVRYAASPKQIASNHESSMAMFATGEGQLNPVNQAQPLMYSFILLNIARLFTKSKPKVKLLHDLCTSSTLFICICETVLFDGINDSEIHLPNFTVIRCDRISREGGGVCIYPRQYFVKNLSTVLKHSLRIINCETPNPCSYYYPCLPSPFLRCN